jgi:hypothetical protein
LWESKWRQNVPDMGFGDTDFRLIARTVGVILPLWLGLTIDEDGVRRSAGSVAVMPAYLEDWTYNVVLGQQPFPFGYRVEPDHA